MDKRGAAAHSLSEARLSPERAERTGTSRGKSGDRWPRVIKARPAIPLYQCDTRNTLKPPTGGQHHDGSLASRRSSSPVLVTHSRVRFKGSGGGVHQHALVHASVHPHTSGTELSHTTTLSRRASVSTPRSGSCSSALRRSTGNSSLVTFVYDFETKQRELE